jgi:hypothetical protein
VVGLQLITDKANSVVITSIVFGKSIHNAVKNNTSDLSIAIDAKIQGKASVPVETIVCGRQ